MARDSDRYYLFNVTFKHYATDGHGKYEWPRSKAKAEKEIRRRNLCKGGAWDLHTKEQFSTWWNSPEGKKDREYRKPRSYEMLQMRMYQPVERYMIYKPADRVVERMMQTAGENTDV